MATSTPSATTWNWAWVLDSDMSSDRARAGGARALARRGSGRRPTSVSPSRRTTPRSRSPDPASARGRVELGQGAGSAGARVRGGAGAATRRSQARPVLGRARRPWVRPGQGEAVVGRRPVDRWASACSVAAGGDQAQRSEVDDPRGCSATGSGSAGTGRTSTTSEPTSQSCHPCRRPPGSMAAVQARGGGAEAERRHGGEPQDDLPQQRGTDARHGRRPTVRSRGQRCRRSGQTPPRAQRRPAARRRRSHRCRPRPSRRRRRQAPGEDGGRHIDRPGDQPVDGEGVEPPIEVGGGRGRHGWTTSIVDRRRVHDRAGSSATATPARRSSGRQAGLEERGAVRRPQVRDHRRPVVGAGSSRISRWVEEISCWGWAPAPAGPHRSPPGPQAHGRPGPPGRRRPPRRSRTAGGRRCRPSPAAPGAGRGCPAPGPPGAGRRSGSGRRGRSARPSPRSPAAP